MSNVYTAPVYDPSNVVVAPAALYLAPKGTALPPDSSVLWDPTNWTGKTLDIGTATAVTLTVVTSAGSQDTASITTLTAPGIQTALEALSNVGTGNVAVTGTGPFKVVFASKLGAVNLSIKTSTGGTPTVSDGLWVPPGATEGGWQFQASRQTQDITIEEQSTPTNRFITSTTAVISGNASESTMTNIQYALNALESVIAQATGQPGMTILTMDDTLVHYAAVLETKNAAGLPRRFHIPDCVAADGLTQSFRRVAQQQLVPLSFAAVCAPQEIEVRNVDSAAL